MASAGYLWRFFLGANCCNGHLHSGVDGSDFPLIVSQASSYDRARIPFAISSCCSCFSQHVLKK